MKVKKGFVIVKVLTIALLSAYFTIMLQYFISEKDKDEEYKIRKAEQEVINQISQQEEDKADGRIY